VVEGLGHEGLRSVDATIDATIAASPAAARRDVEDERRVVHRKVGATLRGLGTTMGRVAWDVPVRLVARAPARAPRVTVRVDPGVPLPGVVALEATTVAGDDGTALERITPIQAPIHGTSGGPADVAGPVPVALADLLDGLRVGGVVPVVVDGTSFMVAVLEALTRVAVGTTCTYAELATAAGRPRAVRAAATVLANNRVPLVLPCHRVVPAAGGAGRYGWGPEAKVALLAAEARP